MTVSVIENYTFDKEAKTITFLDFTTIDLNRIISISDTTNGISFYSNQNPSYTGTVADNILTVKYNTNDANFNNSDKLYIEYLTDNYGVKIASATDAPLGTNVTGTITNYAKGAVFAFSITSVAGSGTPTITFKLQMLDAGSGLWVDIPGAVTAGLMATGVTLMNFYPGIKDTANVAINLPLPRKYRVSYTVTGTTPTFTFTVGANYIN